MSRLHYFPLACLGLASLVAVSTGCSAETGIVIQVTADSSVSEKIDRLEFFVAVHEPGATGVEGDYVNDPDPSEETDFVGGRDLKLDPYKLLLRRGESASDMSLRVIVLGYKGDLLEGAGMLANPVGFVDDKVVMWEVVLAKRQSGGISVSATGCLSWLEDNTRVVIASPDDLDCDGDPASTDCNDMDSSVHTGATERCRNNADDDCDGQTDEETDADSDQVTNCDGDCNDDDNTVYPGAVELCDGKDNDCNDLCDDGDADPDKDDYTICGTKRLDDGTCSEMSNEYIDCKPNVKEINPGAAEICDGQDNNCDEQCDENQDPDTDTFTACGSVVNECAGVTDEDKDCGPNNPEVHPGATEICDGNDNDCNGEFYPEVVPCYATDALNGNECVVGTRQCGDKDGTGWGGPCQPSTGGDPGNVVSNALCMAYDTCVTANAADPFECANDASVTMKTDCTVYHGPNGALCPNAEARLPNLGTTLTGATCSVRIGPGAAIEHYDIRLRPLAISGDGSANLDECEAVLRVHSVYDEAGHDSRLVRTTATDGNTNLATVRKVDFYPMSVPQCSGAGMTCIGLATPGG